MKHLVLMVLVMAGLSFAEAAPKQFDPTKEQERALATLEEISRLVQLCEPHVDRVDYAVLFVFRDQALAIGESIKQVGLGHSVTMNLFQKLIVRFNSMETFFDELDQSVTANYIERLKVIGKTIASERGFDAEPYTKVTAYILYELHRQVVLLQRNVTLTDELRKALEDLGPEIGAARAIAEKGDQRLDTPAAALPIHEKLRTLYGPLDETVQGEEGKTAVIRLIGLNQWYAQYIGYYSSEREKEKK